MLSLSKFRCFCNHDRVRIRVRVLNLCCVICGSVCAKIERYNYTSYVAVVNIDIELVVSERFIQFQFLCIYLFRDRRVR